MLLNKKTKTIIFGWYAAANCTFRSFQIGECKKATVSYHYFYIVAYLSSYHEKTINALYKLA